MVREHPMDGSLMRSVLDGTLRQLRVCNVAGVRVLCF